MEKNLRWFGRKKILSKFLFVMLHCATIVSSTLAGWPIPPKPPPEAGTPPKPTNEIGRLYAPWLWSLSTGWKNLRCWWRPWRWGEKMPDPWRIPMGRIHGIFTYIFYENRESNQRASNQRCEKINNDKHKLEKIICENEKIKNHMSQNKGKQQNIGKNNKK